MAAKVIRDENGTLHRVPRAPPYTTPRGLKLDGTPSVDVWWDREPMHKADEQLIIRQENGGDRADVIVISQGQAHDLLQAVAMALNKP